MRGAYTPRSFEALEDLPSIPGSSLPPASTAVASLGLDLSAAGITMNITSDGSSMRRRFLFAREKVDALGVEHPYFGEVFAQGLGVVRRALDEFGGSPGGRSHLAISFNGGKDACVVLYLLLLVLAEKDQLELISSSRGKGIRVVYFEKEEFPEVDAFMKDASTAYGFDLLRYAASYKDGTQDLVATHGIKAIIMGQRRGDPWTETMEAFTPSTPGWAKFTRVNPALEWKFSHVWRFLRGSGLPYCTLYDQGYTSLGERGDTARNEALRLPSGGYRPAYELAEAQEHLERTPRTPPGETSGTAHDTTRRHVGDSAVTESTDRETSGGGRAGGNEMHSQVLERISTWDSRWSVVDERKGSSVTEEEGFSACTGIEEGKDMPPIGLRVDTQASSLETPGGNGPCVQAKGGSPAGWSLRWLPLTAMMTLLLAAVGLRKSGSSRGGAERLDERGNR